VRGAVTALVLAVVCSCQQIPFFPRIVRPIEPPSPKATPEGVIDQLITSYQNQRIDLFRDLFPADNSFRFYVSPRFVEEYGGTTSRETIGAEFTHVPPDDYFYWNYDSEYRSHRNLFDNAQRIEFTIDPTVHPDDFVYHVNGDGDTVGVEVLMLNGKFTVEAEPLEEAYEIDIQRQVFYLIRDGSGNWVILKWFDFGTAG
jgi:hypothetical protein